MNAAAVDSLALELTSQPPPSVTWYEDPSCQQYVPDIQLTPVGMHIWLPSIAIHDAAVT